MASIQEAIRIVLETEGREGIEAFRAALASIGDVSDETRADADRLLDSLTGLNDAAAKAARFEELSRDLAQTTEALDDASRAALQLSLQLADTDKPSREMVRNYKQVRDEVARLEDVQKRQADAQDRVGRELAEAGVDARDLAKAQQQLRSRVAETTTELERQAAAVREQASAAERQRAAVAEGEAAFRRQAASSRSAAEALRAYRDRVAQAAREQMEATAGAGRLERALGGVRALAAGAAAALGIGSAVDGVRNLLNVAAASENARRALQNLYGSQAAGNAAFERLRAMSESSGVSFNALAESAKKLKAFGIDPLNGTLQAFIDQNAAVGGSQEELEGKLLAVGQAWAKSKLQGEEILQLVERGVPVWDLLQKVTGKNVAEIQKLSEAGKLGRETISALITEIGRANSGAAQAGLSSLSGLMAQITQRWQEFVRAIADAGVADYFKKQIQRLLGSATDLDSVAKRIAAGMISVFEAIRRTAEQLAPLGAAIGNLTLFLARHAETIANVVKAYAALKLAEFALGFGRVTAAVQGTTAAMLAQRAAALGATGSIVAGAGAAQTAIVGLGARIGAVAAGLANLVRFAGWPVAIIASAKMLGDAYLELNRAQLAVETSEARLRVLQADGIRVGRQMQEMNRQYASTIIQSSDEIGRKNREQAESYLQALNRAREYYNGVVRESLSANERIDAGAAGSLQRVIQAIDTTTKRLQALKAEASKAGALGAFADGAVEKFDTLIAKGKQAQEAVQGIFEGLDLSSANGLTNAIGILEQMNARGTAAGRAVRDELQAALAKVANEDLPRLQAEAARAFGTGSAAARQMAAEVQRINLTRLGVDVEAIRSGFTKVGRAVVDQFRGAVQEVDKLGLSAQQRSAAIATAFDNAFRQASTKSEIESLRQALQTALSEGSIGFVEFQTRIAETDAKLAQLSGTGSQLGTSVAEGARQASSSLGNVASAAADAADGADAAADSTEKSGKAMKEGAAEAKAFGLTLGSVSEKFNQAAASANRYANSVNGDTFRSVLNRATQEYDRQFQALQRMNEELDRQIGLFDPLREEIDQLEAEFDFLGRDQLRALVEKRRQLAELERSQAEAAQNASDSAAQAQRDRSAADSTAASTASITRRAGEAADATSQVLDQAERAAAALGSAASQISRAPAGEVVLRVVYEGAAAGAGQLQLKRSDIHAITAAVVAELRRQQGLTR